MVHSWDDATTNQLPLGRSPIDFNRSTAWSVRENMRKRTITRNDPFTSKMTGTVFEQQHLTIGGKNPKCKDSFGLTFDPIDGFSKPLAQVSQFFTFKDPMKLTISSIIQRLHLSLATSCKNLQRASLVWWRPETLALMMPWCFGDLCFKLSRIHWLLKLSISKCGLCTTLPATAWFQAKLRQSLMCRMESQSQLKCSPHEW